MGGAEGGGKEEQKEEEEEEEEEEGEEEGEEEEEEGEEEGEKGQKVRLYLTAMEHDNRRDLAPARRLHLTHHHLLNGNFQYGSQ